MDRLVHLPEGIAAFKALGNAVNVTVVKRILTNLLQLLPPPGDRGAASAWQIEGGEVLNRGKDVSRHVAPTLA
jgi:hypothetical protein